MDLMICLCALLKIKFDYSFFSYYFIREISNKVWAMKCFLCHFENQDNTRFFSICGASLTDSKCALRKS